MAAQPLLFDMTPYLPKEGTLLGAIDDAQAEQLAEIERAAAELAEEIAAEEEQAKRDTAGIRAMLTADLPAGAADRWASGFTTNTAEEIVEEPAVVEEDMRCTSVLGGAHVHLLNDALSPSVMPLCDTGSGQRRMTRYAKTTAPLSCPSCLRIEARKIESTGSTGAPAVDVDALRMSPKVRALVSDIAAGPWHYQTRKGALDRELVTDITATALTAFGERVRAALLVE
ncbi:hypothetical protein Q8791_29015 [Nocardiopsis sp. CT-R113]|uniref:Uncharacterized protein n=1 Tax=Nocardiopsis codii TaxID=3065942 RepID=A0ABU7KGC9_9ACTN|nr:hypothetical protein [Nocardiopsis sp. CT-R113]MEE2041273.1 hypothetical protein [Nocardiopsis sp. CT-R113]